MKILEPGASYQLELSRELAMIGSSRAGSCNSYLGLVPCQMSGPLIKYWRIVERAESYFKVQWKSGDLTWLGYAEAKHLEALSSYLEAMGVSTISQLKQGVGIRPEFDEDVRSDAVRYDSHGVRVSARRKSRKAAKERVDGPESPQLLPLSSHIRTYLDMIHDLSPSQLETCEKYAGDVMGFVAKTNGHAGEPPMAYESYKKLHPMARVPSDFPDVVSADG
ncbi:hypothetical protein C8F04DRAFT_1121623 [Mycena alexandri]|uniref:Uncharacterized protein n=1 Tax=Mycena alexandri TaxID=1745969 RepID=A0AAD6SHR9_9AGAR|nr:hypothetical protein C8F04DRAFT_1121623 [Mycena alexandri]